MKLIIFLGLTSLVILLLGVKLIILKVLALGSVGYILFMYLMDNSIKKSLAKDYYNKYQAEMREYEIKCDQWNKLESLQKQIHNIQNRDISNNLKRQEVLNAINMYHGLKTEINLNNKEGKTERFFYTYLKQEFGNLIQKNLSTFTSNHNDFKTPDYIYRNRSINLVIEIDEPYSLTDRKPIHCPEAKSINILRELDLYHVDDRRNEYYLLNNYAVIRFCEEQIVYSTKDCLNTISSVIDVMKGKSNHNSVYVKSIPRWTWFEAYDMMKINYRENYLQNICNDL